MGAVLGKLLQGIRPINILGAIPPSVGVIPPTYGGDYSILLDGAADRVDFGNLSILDGKTTVSFEAWIYIDSNNLGMMMTDWYLSGGTSKRSWQFYWAGDRKLFALFSYDGGVVNYRGWESLTAVPLQTWTHVAFEVNLTTLVGKWYIDGTGVTTSRGDHGTAPTEVWPGNDQGVVLGSRYENGFEYYADGAFANVALWDSVKWGGNFTAPSEYYVGDESNLLLYCPIWEGAGSTINELVSGNDGTGQSFVEAWWITGPGLVLP